MSEPFNEFWRLSMEPLFRLALVRPAVEQDPANPSIDLTQDTPFQKALMEAAQSENPRDALMQVARSFVAGGDFIGSPAGSPLGAGSAKFSAALERLERNSTANHTKLVKAVEDAFGMSPKALVESETYKSTVRNLRDSLLAIKQLQEEHSRPIEALTWLLRNLELAVKIAGDEAFPDKPGDLRNYRRRNLKLPIPLNLKSVLSTAELVKRRREEQAAKDAERRKHGEELLLKRQNLNQAIAELTALGKEHFQVSVQQGHAGTELDAELTPGKALTQQMAYFEKLSALNLGQLQAAIDRQNGVDPLTIMDFAGARSASEVAKNLTTYSPHLLTGNPPFTPLPPEETLFRLKPSAVAATSQTTRKTLEERNLDVTAQSLDHLFEILQSETEAAGRELTEIYGRPAQRGIKRVGNILVKIARPVVATFPTLVSSNGDGPVVVGAPAPLSDIEQIPHTRGKATPAGVADLLIVKQQLIGYEGADIAHIENVLKGERKLREHTTRRETEEFTFREVETTSAEERELESTDRFEMTRETNNTIKEDASLKAGLNISGKYGPVVEFSASAEGSVSRSKEEATRTAATFSQEVTERSSIKITERVLQRESLRVTNEVIEKNSHELSNIGGTKHISGVYQWVNKVYEAQMFNYGLRTMFDFLVPEPAAFLIEAMNSALANATELEKPPEFTLQPYQVSDTIGSLGYYGEWARLYGATDITPPPEMYKTKSLDFKAGGGDDKTNYNHSAVITIDDGYRAIWGSVIALKNIWGNDVSVDVALGTRSQRLGLGEWTWTTNLNDERDSLPFALDTFRASQVSVAVEVKCQRTERAMEKWRLDTHAKLTTAYKARLSEYEEKLKALEVQQGVAIRGKNPALNLETMNDELKKNCITILTDQHYDLFDSIDLSPSNSLPQMDVTEAGAEGSYVRFFEHAFEWEHMTWITYPYFWGRKNQWEERLAYEDPDPLFNQFLKSGFCRVSVPVRPGFEGAIDHFMNYGELWNGGPLPTISSPLYLPIADEIAERLDRPGDEIPQGDPWYVRIPTTLVHLRADDRLPRWEKDENGEWVEAVQPKAITIEEGGKAKEDKVEKKPVAQAV
jgi:hypothetical protein